MSRARIAVVAGFAVALASGCGDDVMRPDSPYRNGPLVPDSPVSVPLGEPDLQVDAMVVSDCVFGNCNGRNEQGEVVEVTFTISNVGQADATNGTLSGAWIGDSGSRFQWVTGSVAVGTLAPGDSVQLSPLSFMATTAEAYAMGSYALTYSGSHYSEVLDEILVSANVLLAPFTHIPNDGYYWNAVRDDRYLGFISSGPSLSVWAKDLVSGTVTYIDGSTLAGSEYNMTLKDGLMAYISAPVVGPRPVSTLRIADPATGVMTDIAEHSGTGVGVAWWVRPALGSGHLVWNGDGASVLIGTNDDTGPDVRGLRIMDLSTGHHRRLSPVPSYYNEYAPTIDGDWVVYVLDGRARLQNLVDGTDVQLSPSAGVVGVGMANGRVVWSTYQDGLVIHELATGDEIEVQLPPGVGYQPGPISVGDDWAEIAEDYYGTWNAFLIRLSDGAIAPMPAWPAEMTIYEDRLLLGFAGVYEWQLPAR